MLLTAWHDIGPKDPGPKDSDRLGALHPRTATALERTLRPFGFDGPAFEVPGRAALRSQDREPLSKVGPALLVTGVARPADVAATARQLGVEVLDHVIFPDHHAYPASSLARIEERLRATGADVVLTTTKDGVKLVSLEAELVEITLRATPPDGFWQWFDDAVDRLLV